MSAQRSANSKRVDGLRWRLRTTATWLRRLASALGRDAPATTVIPSSVLCVGLLGLLMAGCQTASLRSAADRPAPNINSASPVATAIPLKNRVSFTLVNWQSEEPPPLVSSETGLSSENPLPETPPEYAYDDGEIRFGCDFRNAVPTLWCDTKSIANWNNALILTAAGGLAIGFRQSDIDQQVREEVVEHPERWGHASQVLGNFGEVKYQAPVMLGVYGYSVWTQNEELHDVMGSMLSATVITGVSTSALKLIANTDRPSNKFSNGHYGFPSYHTSSTFAIAAVLDEYYGSHVGLPAYALATAVGFSRIDQQAHDLSDVVFGAALGYVIGKTVATRHLCDDSNLQLSPYVHPTDGTPGIAIEAKF